MRGRLGETPWARGIARVLLRNRVAGALPLLAWIALVSPAGAEPVFEERPLSVEGRPLLAFPVRLGARERGSDLAVLSARGAPPDETRVLTLFATREGARTAMRTIEVPADVVAVDAADVDPAPGEEIVFVSAVAVRVVPTAAEGAGRTLALDPPLPLPPRTRDLSLLGTTARWSGGSEPEILLPTAEGVRLLSLRSGASRPLALPVEAEYFTLDPTTAARDAFFFAQLSWPSFTLGRDDRDARPDLFAHSRYGVQVFRGAAEGLPPRASRVMKLRPFTPEQELRPRATQLQILARDLDGDGLTDLVLHRTFGSLLRSEDRTEVHRNAGDGADTGAPPEARLPPEPGIGILDAVDLDGDGRLELVQARIGFGVVQLLRILTTRNAQAELRVDRLDGPAPPAGAEAVVRSVPGITGASRAWSDTVTVKLDFEQGRLEGLLPTVDGDWNGDGRRDLLLGTSARELAIWLGGEGARGPAFSGSRVTQEAPALGRALVADLDGDGLDDLVTHDPRDPAGHVHWLHNRGTLPGTAPELRAAPAR